MHTCGLCASKYSTSLDSAHQCKNAPSAKQDERINLLIQAYKQCLCHSSHLGSSPVSSMSMMNFVVGLNLPGMKQGLITGPNNRSCEMETEHVTKWRRSRTSQMSARILRTPWYLSFGSARKKREKKYDSYSKIIR